ncbi:transcriptional regulator [Paucilactobacillus vaccinostercus DSM 20634]|jgi:Lrp/AsnC family leucine-responsive transcriptional regulator|uniref:Transcriptional regulator n=1 Tax=Paucilactobacillus vaccinostercus DSM 20634 TaxID=1423813 RepID=A0A0R2AE53_9LACO|nr:Lrp/AsnC family transcriptional regulator [Paucilactobacillus vaccinostercus]KRM61990.1 transcriptional regulator [Paucilactobacillus vaccinostercus DSM 20634]RRG10769.1 MAG: Lrp/AsnC family transcriptional regulator [Lactobacillus sp.]
MDQIDRKILNLLQENARISLKTISEHCFISSPAIAARINRLEKQGVIANYQTTINYEKLDYHVKAFIRLQLDPTQKKDFYPYVRSIPNVLECNCVTGDYSELLEVVFESTAALDEFVNGLQSSFGKTSTQIVFSTSVNRRGLKLGDDATANTPEIEKNAAK